MFRLRATIAALAIGVAISMAGPAAAENVLRWTSVWGADTFDPHSYNHHPTIIQQDPVYERLLTTSARLELVPQLAVAWRPVGPVTWEFELRQGVRFHDGTPFTAEDVVFSIERARAEPSAYADYFTDISDVRSVDAHTVRITTRTPDALLQDRLRKLYIMSKAWAEEHHVLRATDYLAGEATYAMRHANGTGPFVLETFEPGGRIELRRNADWWGYDDYPVNIDSIEFSPMAAPEQRLTALLSGKIDLLTSPPFDALDQIRSTPSLKLEQTADLRTIYLGIDQGSPELGSSDVKGRNPLSDRRVRRAMYQAIDIHAIRDDVMRGLSEPAGMIIPPGVNGYAPEFDQRLSYDPEAARALLADAGYPEGFSITLDCPNNRYINDEKICRVVAEQLGEVGITTSVNAQSQDRHFLKVDAHKSDFFMASSTVETLDSLEVFVNFFGSQGIWNGPGYANPRVDELIEKIGTTSVTYARDAMIEEVWRTVLDDIVYIPLHHQVVVWAMREDLELPVSPLDYPVFREARFR